MPTTDLSDDDKFHAYGNDLVAAVDAALRPWLVGVVTPLLPRGVDVELDAAIDAVCAEANRLLTELAAADVDEPLSGPLQRIRNAMVLLTPALEAAGASRPRRDPFDVEHQPDDVFALGPISFAELGEQVHTAGITWGAAKAHLHMSRRKSGQ